MPRQHTCLSQPKRVEQKLLLKHQAPATVQLIKRLFGTPIETVFRCIVAGVGLGHLLPGLFAAIASAEIARVNLPVAGLVWLMIIPMLLKIDFGALGQVRQHDVEVGSTERCEQGKSRRPQASGGRPSPPRPA